MPQTPPPPGCAPGTERSNNSVPLVTLSVI